MTLPMANVSSGVVGFARQSVFENENLDKWQIPFGQWIEEIVFWLTTNIGGLLDAIKWPVDQMLKLVIDNLLQDWLPWPVVLALFFLLGISTRNARVGAGSAAALLVCGLLGDDYWNLTMETIGMITVAVIICAVVGVPLGIFSARVDSFWNRLRPILDGMQVIHPFVYLLPIIFLFGVRRTPGVLATLVFALPPIVRLTNLGVRQVPEDVVEAARAFGATERRVLREVQLPLARPAIMAGLNQTLLLSLSMVGIVAIIAGGGLGKPILTALNTSDIPTGASAGAGLYFVGVLLDRISQPEAGDRRANLFSKMRSAWDTRSEPIVPPMPDGAGGDASLPSGANTSKAKPAPLISVDRPRWVASTVAIAAGVLGAVSTLLTWGNGAGRLTSHFRFDDLSLVGPHSGLDATGGSWFGGLILIIALAAVAGGVAAIWFPKYRESTLALVSTLLACGTSIVAVAAAYLTVHVLSDDYSNGIGPWLAVAAGLALVASAAIAMFATHVDLRRVALGWRDALGLVVLAVFLIFAGAKGSWILDQRSDAAELAKRLAGEAGGGDQGGLAAEILAEAMSGTRRVTIGGLESGGPQIGYVCIVLAALAALAQAGRWIATARVQRNLSLATYALGVAIACVGIAWIASAIRLDTNQIAPGASAFLTVCGGLVLASRGWRSARMGAASAARRPAADRSTDLPKQVTTINEG